MQWNQKIALINYSIVAMYFSAPFLCCCGYCFNKVSPTSWSRSLKMHSLWDKFECWNCPYFGIKKVKVNYWYDVRYGRYVVQKMCTNWSQKKATNNPPPLASFKEKDFYRGEVLCIHDVRWHEVPSWLWIFSTRLWGTNLALVCRVHACSPFCPSAHVDR